MIRNFFFSTISILGIFIFFTSCSDKDETEIKETPKNAVTYAVSLNDSLYYISKDSYLKALDGTIRFNYLDKTKAAPRFPFEMQDFWGEENPTPTPPPSGTPITAQSILAYSYINKELVSKGNKLFMSSALKEELGLKNYGGIIIYDVYKVSQKLMYKPDHSITIPPYSKKVMGKTSFSVLDLNQKMSFDYETITEEAVSFTGYTYLVFIQSDLSRPIKKWYPCKPEELIWAYTLVSLKPNFGGVI